MSLFIIGRLCLKIAGRDAGNKCVIVEKINDNFVLIDGAVRRRKVNLRHLEPLAKIIEIKEKATHEEVKNAFEKLGLLVWDKKSKTISARPVKQRKVKAKKVVDKKVKTEIKKDTNQEIKKEVQPKVSTPEKEVDKVAETKVEAVGKK